MKNSNDTVTKHEQLPFRAIDDAAVLTKIEEAVKKIGYGKKAER